MAPHMTGSDWTQLQDVAAAHGIRFRTDNGPRMLGKRYRVCARRRIVFLEGGLPLVEWASAAEHGVAELVFANVVTLPVRPRRSS